MTSIKKIISCFGNRDNFWDDKFLASSFFKAYQYPYNLFCKDREVEISKIFYYRSKYWDDLFDIFEMAAYTFQKSNKLPIVIGINEKGQPIIKDLLKQPHLLIAGMTGSGKSTLIYSVVLSLLYFCHPEYVRIVVLDGKDSFAVLEDVLTYEHETLKIAYMLEKMIGQMKETQESFRKNEDNLKSNNARAYKSRDKKNLQPFTILILEECTQIVQKAKKLTAKLKRLKEKDKYERDIEVLERVDENISDLASQSRSAGFCIIFSTQYPKSTNLSTDVKANVSARICMYVNSYQEADVILGSRKSKEKFASIQPQDFQNPGEGVFKKMGKLESFNAIYTHFYALKMAANQLTKNGFCFKL